MINWLDILESHFNKKKKAFLIFDESHVLQYISEYAKEILGIEESHIGCVTLNELFPPSENNPQFLVDKNYSFQTIYDILYTMPSGRSKELRINRDPDLHTVEDIQGYVIWLEAKSRDITAVYKKVSSLDPFLNFGWLFEQNDLGFILKSMKNAEKPQSEIYTLKYHGFNETLSIKWSGLPLSDLEGSLVGAIITASPADKYKL